MRQVRKSSNDPLRGPCQSATLRRKSPAVDDGTNRKVVKPIWILWTVPDRPLVIYLAKVDPDKARQRLSSL